MICISRFMMSILDKLHKIISHEQGQFDSLYSKWKPNYQDEYFEKIHWDFYPFLEKYYFEANPSYFYEYKNLLDIGRYPVVMLRDGFLGVLSFFFKYHTPSDDLDTIILVHRKFEKLVPRNWNGRVALYDIVPRSDIPKKNNDSLVIYANPVAELLWDEDIKTIFKRYAEPINRYKNVSCIFPTRTLSIYGKNKPSQDCSYNLLAQAKTMISSIVSVYPSFDIFMNVNKTAKFDFLNLDEAKIFNADNFVDHLLYSHGHQNMREFLTETEAHLGYNLSMGHQVRIFDCDVENSEFKKYYFHYKAEPQRFAGLYSVGEVPEIEHLYQQHFNS